MSWNFIVNTLRYLKKNMGFTVLNISGLAVGFACAILVFTYAFKELSYNSKIPDKERIFYLAQKSPDSPLGNTTISYALPPMLAAHFPEIEYFARTENFSSFSNCIISCQPSGNKEILSFNEPEFYLADNDLFRIVQYPFVEGTAANAMKEPNSIILSKETAKKYFGDQPALGKTLTLNSEHVFNVSGVVDIPTYVTFKFSMLAPITTLRSKSELEGWNSNGQPLFKLNKSVDYKDFNTKIEHFYSEIAPEQIRNPEQLTLSVLPITERRLYYNKNPLYLLIFISLVVLVISIMNYINMSTSMVQKRNSEIALKKISGASVNLIRRQFMLETALICLAAVLLGVVLTFTGTPIIQKLIGSDVLPFLKDNIVFFISGSVILWLTVTLFSGFYPSFILSGIKPLSLFHKGRKTTSGVQSKNVVITFQFAISILLIIITLMVGRQYRFMKDLPLGFDNELVMQIPFNNKLKQNFQNLTDELKLMSSVRDVCAASAMPAGVPNNSGAIWTDDKNEKHDESFGFVIVSEGFTQTFQMKMALGDEFTRERQEELKGVIVNESAAKQLGYENPIGKSIDFWGKQNTIIGVVKDFQNNYLFNKVKPMILSAHPDNQGFTKYLFVSIRPDDIQGTILRIEKTIQKFSPEFPFEYSFTNAELDSYINEIKQINSAFNFGSFISLLLSVIGLVALAYHTIQSKIKEIGIRKVNGARSSEIVWMLNSSFLQLVIIAFVIASPVAWLVISQLLQGIENHTTISWLIFALGGMLTFGIALITVSLQSWKAATKNPVEALRYE
jgi:putative ABC transport system permease protein